MKKDLIFKQVCTYNNGVNMGKKNNRTFYKIPFLKLINKLKYKMKLLGSEVIINEESIHVKFCLKSKLFYFP